MCLLNINLPHLINLDIRLVAGLTGGEGQIELEEASLYPYILADTENTIIAYALV